MSGGTWRMEIAAPGCSFLNNGFTPEQFICPCWEDESGCPVVVRLMSAVMSLEDQLSSAFSLSQLVTQGVCWVRKPRPGYHQCRNSTEGKETPVNYLIYLKWEGKETWDEVGDLICFLLWFQPESACPSRGVQGNKQWRESNGEVLPTYCLFLVLVRLLIGT